MRHRSPTEPLSLELYSDSSDAWRDCVLADFDTFLADHADAERKASSMAMSFVAKYPDREAIIPELIHTAIEELEHFRLVHKLMRERGLRLNHAIGEDHYVKALLKWVHSDREKRFRDRLIIASIVEHRGFERFRQISEHHPEKELRDFYRMIYLSEAKHGDSFVMMAQQYFPRDEVQARWLELAAREAEILAALPLRASLH